MRQSGRNTLHGSLTSGSDRCAAGFARHQSWMKVRRKEDASGRLKTSTYSSVGTCGLCFECDRALRCHEQVAHKKRTPVKHWAPVSGTCCVCGLKFSTRLRLIAHLNDRRQKGSKPPCRASLGRYEAIDSCEVVRMDELDGPTCGSEPASVCRPRWTRGPSVIKRIGPRNGCFLLNSL